MASLKKRKKRERSILAHGRKETQNGVKQGVFNRLQTKKSRQTLFIAYRQLIMRFSVS
ncbi:MAG: hypothetical protein ACOYID_06530 [Eubacteriales bacterium]|jgi:hypothetical protein